MVEQREVCNGAITRSLNNWWGKKEQQPGEKDACEKRKLLYLASFLLIPSKCVVCCDGEAE